MSALLNLVPQLIELDIGVPPTADILRLADCEGDVILVTMLRALYLHDMDGRLSKLNESFKIKTLAQVLCEFGGKDSEDAVKPSLARRNTLDMLCIVFDSTNHRHYSHIILKNWYYTPEEDKAVDMFFRWNRRLTSPDLFNGIDVSIPKREHNYLGVLDELFACIELYREAITSTNVLRVGNSFLHMVYVKCYIHIFFSFRMTNIHVISRRIIVEDLITIPGQDNLKQLLLNNLDEYCWARVASSESSPSQLQCDLSFKAWLFR